MCWKCFMAIASRRVQRGFKKGKWNGILESRWKCTSVAPRITGFGPFFHAPQREGQRRSISPNCRQSGIRGLDSGDVIDCCSITVFLLSSTLRREGWRANQRVAWAGAIQLIDSNVPASQRPLFSVVIHSLSLSSLSRSTSSV
jgi:hypothetical protein